MKDQFQRTNSNDLLRRHWCGLETCNVFIHGLISLINVVIIPVIWTMINEVSQIEYAATLYHILGCDK